ncbi:hypothetical protein MLD38_034615 [Melastoma candidum]|uniref:Uncharacterized protein n=1 Tax=Melastoma candidum TaxID=119954 RepID=A0ACB9MAM6_9MYRT|nr:hypothetical protein MLD38_034615 [Melastoma candidum]
MAVCRAWRDIARSTDFVDSCLRRAKFYIKYMSFGDGEGETVEYDISCWCCLLATCNGLVLLEEAMKRGGLLVSLCSTYDRNLEIHGCLGFIARVNMNYIGVWLLKGSCRDNGWTKVHSISVTTTFDMVFVNAPWSYLACFAMVSPFLTKRPRSKFVFASPAKTPETLFKYISLEQIPIQCGGLSTDCCSRDTEFTINDPATKMTVKPGSKQIVEIIGHKRCTLVWDLRVISWEVRYRAEFVPDAEGGCPVDIQKPRNMSPKGERWCMVATNH